MFIRDTKNGKKIKCIQVNPITFKELRIISKKDFMVKDISSKDSKIESDTKKEDFKNKS